MINAIQKIWHWVMAQVKQFWKWTLGGLVIGIVIVAALEARDVPEELRLKTNKTNIVASAVQGDRAVYFYKDKVAEIYPDEVERTYNSVRRKIEELPDGQARYFVEASVGWKYHNENGVWYELKHATTTKSEFNRQTKSLTERIVSKVLPFAFAATEDDQVSAGDHDAYELNNDTGFNTGTNRIQIQSHTSSSQRGGFLFDNIAVPQGATIDTAYWEGYLYNTSVDDARFDGYMNDVDDAADFTADADVVNRTLTTASVFFSQDSAGVGWYGSGVEIKTIIQEVVDRGSWALGNAMMFIGVGRDDQDKSSYFRNYEFDTSLAAKLHIEYTAASTETPKNIINSGKIRLDGGKLRINGN